MTWLGGGCGFRKETIAGMHRNGRDAPKADRGGLKRGRQQSTHCGRQAELGPNNRSMIRSAPPSKQRPWLSTIRRGCQE